MKRILPFLLLGLVGCMSVFVPNTPAGKHCSDACASQNNECKTHCNGRSIDACEGGCDDKNQKCLIICPGAYKK